MTHYQSLSRHQLRTDASFILSQFNLHVNHNIHNQRTCTYCRLQ